MSTGASRAKPDETLGFFTVIEDTHEGLYGGYLVLDQVGRPLEFHCTAPVKPNRAQEILYGPTLEPFLYGEQIGHTLITRASLAPTFVITDVEPAMSVREYVDVPVLLLLAGVIGSDLAEGSNSPVGTADRGSSTASRLLTRRWSSRGSPVMLRYGSHEFALTAADRNEADARLERLHGELDFREPFSRIRLAVEEARRGGR